MISNDSMFSCRLESEFKDYVQKAIFLRDVAGNEDEMSESNDTIIIMENSVKLKNDEDSNASTVNDEELTIQSKDKLESVNQCNGQRPVASENNDKNPEMNQSHIDQTPIEEKEPITKPMEVSSTDCKSTPLKQQLNRSESNVESPSGVRSTSISDKSCPKVRMSPSTANNPLSRSNSEEVKGSSSINEPPTNGHSDKLLPPANVPDPNTQNIRLESKRTQSSNYDKSANILKDVMYYCSHCAFNEPNPEPYNNLKALLNHWPNRHAKEPVPRFLFQVGTTHRCISCSPNRILKSFRSAMQHFQQRHSDEQFFVADQRDDKKCSICEFKNGDLAEHFKLNHPFVTSAFVFDPIRLNINELEALAKIQMHKGEKCDKILVSKQKANNQKCEILNEGTKFQQLFEEIPTTTTIICGECTKEIHDEKEFIKHFKRHKFKNDDKLGHSYYKTKYLYANGLIVHKYNSIDRNEKENEKIKEIIHDLNMKTENGVNNEGCSKNPKETEATENLTHLLNEVNTVDRELGLQREELNKLIIFGDFARFLSEQFLYEYFIWICQTIDQYVVRNDIKSIRQTSRGITVELISVRLKNQILDKVEPNMYFLPTRESKIKIVPMLTEYYRKLSTVARKMIAKKQIFRERICKYGLAIQVHQNNDNNNEMLVVNTIEELEKCVAQYEMPPKRPRNHFQFI